MSKSSKNYKVQANVDPTIKAEAESIIKEVGLTPIAVINGLYHEIVATGKIPLSFSLTKKQRIQLRIKELSQNKPVKKIRSQKDLEEFYIDED